MFQIYPLHYHIFELLLKSLPERFQCRNILDLFRNIHDKDLKIFYHNTLVLHGRYNPHRPIFPLSPGLSPELYLAESISGVLPFIIPL